MLFSVVFFLFVATVPIPPGWEGWEDTADVDVVMLDKGADSVDVADDNAVAAPFRLEPPDEEPAEDPAGLPRDGDGQSK